MTPWLIFGAGGKGVGALTAKLALAENRPVVALVRNEEAAAKLREAGAQVIIGDACDSDAVTEACRLAGKETTVISTMGGAQDYLAHRTVIDCAEKSRDLAYGAGHLFGLRRKLGLLVRSCKSWFRPGGAGKISRGKLAANQHTGLCHRAPPAACFTASQPVKLF
ncbi:Putative NADH-flavin reductase [Cedecea neteri]|uniref:NADH-flavin reductase n=1 Tax=Cedecea neteri TaxID=158822 RepID=A0A2X2SYN3_9ENTR|nr:Putative NADH-flavin reductase [Cedecea neteri]